VATFVNSAGEVTVGEGGRLAGAIFCWAWGKTGKPQSIGEILPSGSFLLGAGRWAYKLFTFFTRQGYGPFAVLPLFKKIYGGGRPRKTNTILPDYEGARNNGELRGICW